ncbi:uncharacterized protein LOC135211996 [Macrobrachium nipponense]|uniref:uncharacterized protein LOC135211996 n=1 Tax=Macrobrachium nipponense TaxID=159736 RepID=UPI0030C84DDE
MTAIYWVLAVTFVKVVASESPLDSLLGSEMGSGKWGKGLGNDSNDRLSLTSAGENATAVGHSRRARQLIDFPDDAVFEVYFKLITPYWTYGNVKTRGDYRLEVTFQLPNELRKKRSLAKERSNMYGILSDFMTKAGLDGDTCVLRAVCEIGESPLDEYGLFGEFINLIFAPGFRSDSNQHKDEIQAEEYGRSFGNCWSAFPDCPVSLRQMLYDFFITNSEGDLFGEN